MHNKLFVENKRKEQNIRNTEEHRQHTKHALEVLFHM